jgi:hypothetical protein
VQDCLEQKGGLPSEYRTCDTQLILPQGLETQLFVQPKMRLTITNATASVSSRLPNNHHPPHQTSGAAGEGEGMSEETEELIDCDLDTMLPPETHSEFLDALAERLSYKFTKEFGLESECQGLDFSELEDADELIRIDFTVSTWRAIIQNLRIIAQSA